MDIMLYVSQGAPHPSQPPMHPINALRNRAIAAAQTEVFIFGPLFFFSPLKGNCQALVSVGLLLSVASIQAHAVNLKTRHHGRM